MIRVDATPYLRGPAPFPEWRWTYYFKPTLSRLWPLGLTAPGILLLIGLTDRPWRAQRRSALLLLFLALPLGVGWQLALCELEVNGATATLVSRTANPLFSSYLHAADLPAAEVPQEYLSNYEELQPLLARWAPHAATHPPTATLLFRAGIELCERVPALRNLLLERIASAAVDPRGIRPRLSPEALAASLLLSWTLLLLGAATALPLYALATQLHGERMAAVRLGLLWLLLPGPTLMVPELDPALALPLMIFAAGLAATLAAPRRPPPRAAWIAGAGAGVAMLLSYGAPIFLALSGLALLASYGGGTSRLPVRRWLLPLALIVGVALLIFCLPALWGARPLAQARQALLIHRAGFTAPRSYLLWLLFNPLDFLLFLGLPLILAAVTGLGGERRSRRERSFARVWTMLLLVLLASGVLRGEVGRIAIPLMPMAALAWVPRPGRGDASLIAALCALTAVALRLAWQLP
jgi:hypothetical protein